MCIPNRNVYKFLSTYNHSSLQNWGLKSKHLEMFSCSKCNKNFKNWSRLMEHNNRRTPCRTPTHHCDRCNKGFAFYQSLWNRKKGCEPKKLFAYENRVNQAPGQFRRIQSVIGQKRPSTDGDGLPKRSNNPKIQALVNEIIKGSPTPDQSEPPEIQLAATDVSPSQMPRAKGDITGYSDDEVSSIKIEFLLTTVPDY